MARASKAGLRLDAPKGLRSGTLGGRRGAGNDRFGRFTEAIARGMGTPWFLLGLTVFAISWILWNTLAPPSWRFDSVSLGFIALTLVLSMQASYAAPMILLAQNRQDDRDRVQFEQDRQRSERTLADTEYLAREVVALRIAMKDLASKDFIRSELRALLEILDAADEAEAADAAEAAGLTRPAPTDRPDRTERNRSARERTERERTGRSALD
ncbi:DUF1003 domain-containing protein [Cryobacterium melibiosiphilum]|uniref:DUF1003 domain-containing protein n=1 Tax=Cryobacterium melibiosiphilum TaxID=995039 RepID=A0A3A5MHQ5_9MICO|nr:DUF1003 domain-containing protein [Cryobacterium melibiosiphilum]RJT88381.1 DUF1003 domain-containing protein [Cryobacterium melibiosiphilum]